MRTGQANHTLAREVELHLRLEDSAQEAVSSSRSSRGSMPSEPDSTNSFPTAVYPSMAALQQSVMETFKQSDPLALLAAASFSSEELRSGDLSFLTTNIENLLRESTPPLFAVSSSNEGRVIGLSCLTASTENLVGSTNEDGFEL